MREAAEYARCVVIRFVNSVARSTVELSSDEDWIVPEPLASASLIVAVPELSEA
jgi:hypothetical protein